MRGEGWREEGELETFRPEMRRVEGYLVVVGMESLSGV